MLKLDLNKIIDIYKLSDNLIDFFEIEELDRGYDYKVNFYSIYEDDDGEDEDGRTIYRKSSTIELTYYTCGIGDLKVGKKYRLIQNKVWEY